MRVLLLPLLALLCASCQRWNPDLCDEDHPCALGRYCEVPDGGGRGRCQERLDMSYACTTSAGCPDDQPLCDTAAGLCRACAAGEDRQCAERDPARPRCAARRCAECLPEAAPGESADCKAAAPVCDSDARCRPCRLHNECASGVCVKDDRGAPYGLPQGSCAPASAVLVVDQLVCNDAGPVYCTPASAIARLDRDHRYVVFRRAVRGMETLLSELDVGLNDPQRGVELTLIGPLADGPPDALSAEPPLRIGGVRPRRGFVIWPRTRVTLEGFLIYGSQSAIDCLGDTNNPTEVRLVRSLIGDNRVGASIKNNCHLTVSESWLGRRPARGGFGGLDGNRLAIDVQGSDLDIDNSVIAGNGAADAFGGIRVAGLGSRPLSLILNTTFYAQSGRADGGAGRFYTDLFCEGAALDRLVLANSLLLHDPAFGTPGDGHVSPACGGLYYSIGSGDPMLTANQSVVVPTPPGAGFHDAATLDLRLSRAADGAAQRALQGGGQARISFRGATISAPTVDLDHRARPGGGRVAIGAYEPVP